MIDPTSVPWYDKDTNELEEIILFCLLVAGKNAARTARSLDNFLRMVGWQPGNSPFKMIRLYLDARKGNRKTYLELTLRRHGIGCYKLKAKGIEALISGKLNLRTCTIQDLEAIPGIGPKTARFFTLHTRRDVQVACLDTHILRFMREELNILTPKSTPQGKKYIELEKQFLDYAKSINTNPATLDAEIWNRYSKSGSKYTITNQA